ncbi:MAG: hypothetical protein MI807_14170 [Verrucomicrobiales bacterium]|nr:hypothetical protein [Verrucomicrobiales bacterium]
MAQPCLIGFRMGDTIETDPVKTLCAFPALHEIHRMKSAYELAMERLNDSEPQVKLTDEQKAEIAAIDDKFKAKIAERELFLDDLIRKAETEGNFVELPQLQEQKAREIAALKEECEAGKEEIRSKGVE